MAGHFDFLSRAKPASLYKLLEKLPTDEAAIVLTGLPHTLAIQALAFFPEPLQGIFLPLMREARSVPEGERETVAAKIHAMLGAAKAAREGKPAPAPPPRPSEPQPHNPHPAASKPPTPAAPPPAAASRPPAPAAPANAPSARKIMPGTANPYESAPPPKAPAPAEKPPKHAAPSPLTGLGTMLKDVLNKAAASALTPASPPSPPDAPASRERPKNTGKPTPWVPRTATSSPINGPALPGKPPPIAGDPFASPLARAGLLDLIGRAQDKLLPKGTAGKAGDAARGQGRPPLGRARALQRPRLGKDGRPEPREGVARPGEVEISRTPRVIGPKPKAPAPAAGAGESAAGARRMDGKAILAAILREAGPVVREVVREDDPGLMRELRGRMFYFDDLIYTDDGALAKVFTAAPADTAALALKFAAPELRRRVLRAVSPGRAKALGDVAGRAGFDAVEAAQKRVLDVALQLQSAGRILIDPRDPDLAGK